MSDPSNKKPAPVADINFLSSSTNRIEILESFAEADSLTRREVRTLIDASRSTVRRTLEEFVERRLITATDDGYRITARGDVLAANFRQLMNTVRITEEYEPLFRWLPPSAINFDPEWLDGATMVVSTETNPYAPAERQTETVREADSFRMLLPAIELEGAKLVRDRVTDGTLDARIVVPNTMHDTIRTDPFADLFREKLASDHFDAFVYPDSLLFYLGLPDENRVEIGAMDDDGIPRVLVQSTRAELRRWGDRVFERHREEAKPLDAGDI